VYLSIAEIKFFAIFSIFGNDFDANTPFFSNSDNQQVKVSCCLSDAGSQVAPVPKFLTAA